MNLKPSKPYPLLFPNLRNDPDGRGRATAAPGPGASRRWVVPADCREALGQLPENAAALVLTDPPYFLDGMDAGWESGRLRARIRPGVIGGLPAGMRFDPGQGRRPQEFLEPIAREWLRLLKPGGFALCFSQPRLAHRATSAIEDAGFEIRDLLAWTHEGQAKAFSQDHFVRRRKIPEAEKRRILRSLGGRKTPQLKPLMDLIVLAQAPREGTFVDNWLRYGVGLIDTSSPVVEPSRFPATVIPVGKARRRFGHLTPKPVKLLRHLIRIFAPEGSWALVLDPFAGSGSTGVAALQEGRRFLGFEVDPAIAETAEARIASHN